MFVHRDTLSRGVFFPRYLLLGTCYRHTSTVSMHYINMYVCMNQWNIIFIPSYLSSSINSLNKYM